jgi:aspartyl-tRNA(Asn)/glutamyl-tRNA(Gln) amidotransferase subunit A
MKPYEMSVRALRTCLDAGELSAGEVIDSCIERIKAEHGQAAGNESAAQNAASLRVCRAERLNAFIEVFADEARARACEQEKRLAAGERAPLLGIPLAYKDNLHFQGHALTAASRALEGYSAAYTATVLERAVKGGANILGRTNMDEFALGSSGETSCFGPARNPHNRECSPGGSSSGSAAAVAAGLVPCALGSDSGGSVRQPASFCGIVGIKPSFGRISRHGLVSVAPSLDQVGIFARTVEDAALVLTELAGFDPLDSASANRAVPAYASGLAGDLAGLKIGLPKEYFAQKMDAEVVRAAESVCMRLREQGAIIMDVSLPHFEFASAAYCVLAGAEVCASLGRFDGRGGRQSREACVPAELCAKSGGEGFGSEVRRRILLGAYVLSAGNKDDCYKKALLARRLITRDFEQAFITADVLLTPASPAPAFPLAAKAGDHVSMYLSDIFTNSASLAGLPAVSLPAAYSTAGLPIGIQLIAPPFAEELLLRAAYRIESVLGLGVRIP